MPSTGLAVVSLSPASPPPGASGPLLAATLLLPLIALWSTAPGTLTAAGLW